MEIRRETFKKKSTNATCVCTNNFSFQCWILGWAGDMHTKRHSVTKITEQLSSAFSEATQLESCHVFPGFLCCCVSSWNPGLELPIWLPFLPRGGDTNSLPCGDTTFSYLVYLKITYSDWLVTMSAIKNYTNKLSFKFIKLVILFGNMLMPRVRRKLSTVSKEMGQHRMGLIRLAGAVGVDVKWCFAPQVR